MRSILGGHTQGDQSAHLFSESHIPYADSGISLVSASGKVPVNRISAEVIRMIHLVEYLLAQQLSFGRTDPQSVRYAVSQMFLFLRY
jgi:hypothetical protein